MTEYLNESNDDIGVLLQPIKKCNMHVHELNPKRTVITMVIFVIVIIVGLLTLTRPRLQYKLSPNEAISMVTIANQGVDASEIDNMLIASNNATILIDIRNNYDYARSHIASAKNISAVELLSKDNIKWLKELQEENTTVVIYGDTPLQGNGPWMVFQQLGFDNITFLEGGYDYYLKYKVAEERYSYIPPFEAGAADYDYAEVAKPRSIGAADNNKPAKKHTVVRRKKKGAAIAGGC
jgi:rhodanese-related sulfurtransferase